MAAAVCALADMPKPRLAAEGAAAAEEAPKPPRLKAGADGWPPKLKPGVAAALLAPKAGVGADEAKPKAGVGTLLGWAPAVGPPRLKLKPVDAACPAAKG